MCHGNKKMARKGAVLKLACYPWPDCNKTECMQASKNAKNTMQGQHGMHLGSYCPYLSKLITI